MPKHPKPSYKLQPKFANSESEKSNPKALQLHPFLPENPSDQKCGSFFGRLCLFAAALGSYSVLGGSWVVISGVISPLTRVISIDTLLITLKHDTCSYP